MPSSVPRLFIVALVTWGCGGSSPSAPTTPPSAQPPGPSAPSTSVTLNGRVVGTVTGEPIAGATVIVGPDTFVTDSTGGFTVTTTTASSRTLEVRGNGILTRQSRLSVGGRDVTIDVIQDRLPFDLAFFRRFARNAFETESGLEELRVLGSAPRIHIRTVDEAGRRIDSRTLNLVEDALRDSASEWSGGRFPLQVVERGSESRMGQSGWINVVWPAVVDDGICGRATIGTTTGFIELQYRNEACYCGSRDLFSAMTVRHELGHVYGYWHTGSVHDVMFGGEWPERSCDRQPSDREIAHAKYMYSRTSGNRDPDTDPSGTLLREPRTIVIDD